MGCTTTLIWCLALKTLICHRIFRSLSGVQGATLGWCSSIASALVVSLIFFNYLNMLDGIDGSHHHVIEPFLWVNIVLTWVTHPQQLCILHPVEDLFFICQCSEISSHWSHFVLLSRSAWFTECDGGCQNASCYCSVACSLCCITLRTWQYVLVQVVV